MATIYTHNNKVLKNTATDKWLIKYVPPGPTFDEVTIGTQTWMAKNLAIDDGGAGIMIKENVTANNVNFGTQYYYTWDAANRIANSISGWHLPNYNEFGNLSNYVNNNASLLKSVSGWNANNGTDNYNFTAYPVGYRYGTDISEIGKNCGFWTCTQDSIIPANATCYSMDYRSSTISNTGWSKSWFASIRLIKDT